MKQNKKFKKVWGSLFLFSVFCSCLTAGALSSEAAEEKEAKVSVLFTHDMHSHFNSFSTVFQGEETCIGGFSRIKTIINEQRAKDPETLVLDGGDFSMGTLFQTIYEEEASELRMLGSMGYDATTFGNHEFDYRTDGVCNMLETAVSCGEKVPKILLCNVDWSDMDENQQKLKEAFEDYGVKNYTVIEKNGVKIALLGVFGKDSLACAPTCALKFKDPVEAVKETVAEIKEKEDVDMIVALSHSGTSENADDSEDEILAKEVPELDVIISGHTHSVLEEPIIHGNTAIVSCGEYGERVGSFTLVQNEEGRWDIEDYKLIPVTEDIPEDKETQERIDSFEKSIDEKYLAQFGYTSEQVLAYNEYSFSSIDDIYNVHTEHNLGDIMSDAYVYAVEHAADYDGIPVDFAVVPSGSIRDTYVKGNITVSDVFNSFSLGIGPDGVPGYPLVSVYLTGKELKMVAEIDASISDHMTSARLYISGMNFTYNPNRMILNRVTDVYLTKQEERVEIEDDKLYRVVADLYSGQMLSAVTDKSKGLLSITPKYADGTPVEDFEDCIIYENGAEIKAWAAIAGYMESFEKNDAGVAVVPAYYDTLHDRKVVDNSRNIVKRIENPNKYTAMIVGVLIVAIAFIICIIKVIIGIGKKLLRKK